MVQGLKFRRIARSQGWTCVLDATSNQGRGPLQRHFPDQWHLIERQAIQRPKLHRQITIGQAFRQGWVPSLFVSQPWQSPKRNRLCAQHVVRVMGRLPVLEVHEGTLRALERRLLRQPTRKGRPLCNAVVRRAVTLTRRSVLQLQVLMGERPRVSAEAKGPRKRQGIVLERRPGSVAEFAAVWSVLPNRKVKAAVALICAGATEAEVQRMRFEDLGRDGWVWLPAVGLDRNRGRWIVLPQWARPAVARWCRQHARVPGSLLFPNRDDPRRPMSSLTPTLKKASQRAGVRPFTVSRLGRVYQGVTRHYKVARCLVRRSAVHGKAETAALLNHSSGYLRLARVMGNWQTIGGVPPSLWAGARIPKRAPKGTGDWEAE